MSTIRAIEMSKKYIYDILFIKDFLKIIHIVRVKNTSLKCGNLDKLLFLLRFKTAYMYIHIDIQFFDSVRLEKQGKKSFLGTNIKDKGN